MDIQRETLPKSQLKLTITVPVAELAPFMTQAITHIGQSLSLPGFRPGHIPADMVKKHVGADTLWQEMVHLAVPKILDKLVREEKLHVIGHPKANVTSETPDTPLVFDVIVSLLPTLTMPDFTTIKVEKKSVVVTDADIDAVLKDVREKRSAVVTENRPAAVGDRVEIDFEGKVDGVVFEGGTATNYALRVGDNNLIPGFEDNLVGMSLGDKKTFAITFPAEYHAKNLAGKAAEFTVTMKLVQNIVLPELDDTFAASVNPKITTLLELRDTIRENITQEKTHAEQERYEIAAIEATAKAATVEIPDVLIEGEMDNMMHELEHELTRVGSTMADYLTHIKKTADQLRADQRTSAETRTRNNLLIHQIATDNAIVVSDAELDGELQEGLRLYEGSEQFGEITKAFDDPAYRDRLRTVMRNRKAISWLMDKIK